MLSHTNTVCAYNYICIQYSMCTTKWSYKNDGYKNVMLANVFIDVNYQYTGRVDSYIIIFIMMFINVINVCFICRCERPNY